MYTNPEQEPLIDKKDYEYENEQNLDSLINAQLRKGFIAKVYSIFIIQILSTSIFIFFAYYSTSFYTLLYDNILFFLLSITLLILCMVITLCYPEYLRKVPHNYIILAIFTLTESYFVASITCEYTPKSVFIVLILTFTSFVTLTIYAIYTKHDITVFGGVLTCLLVLLIVGSFILIFVKIKIMQLIMDIFGVLLFMAYIVYDTQLIVRGDGKFQFSIDDYILASLNLYLDIINLFIYLLSIFGDKK